MQELIFKNTPAYMENIPEAIDDNELRLLGQQFYNDATFISAKLLTEKEIAKNPKRYNIINFLSRKINAQHYLEIGVGNPENNFNLITIKNKYSVDPGYEFELNLADYKMTSDEFFLQLNKNNLALSKNIKFDIIFIDGLHLAYQVEKDIENAMKLLSKRGYIVMHDCNPPTEHHAREIYDFINGPAYGFWNGTTWKAFVKARTVYYSCCIDSDWGVGILSKKKSACLNKLSKNENSFFDFNIFQNRRKQDLNLLTFEEFSASFE